VRSILVTSAALATQVRPTTSSDTVPEIPSSDQPTTNPSVKKRKSLKIMNFPFRTRPTTNTSCDTLTSSFRTVPLDEISLPVSIPLEK
uniref:hypothetical protein n=1 Tax=Klebsiella pneumoniae TaxID=573 RepID=UPI001C8FA051